MTPIEKPEKLEEPTRPFANTFFEFFGFFDRVRAPCRKYK
jgi:hypothetical protein